MQIKARQRLLEAADPAAKRLAEIVRDSKAATTDQIRAAVAILDRAGYGAGSTVQMVGADGGAVKIEGTPELRHLTDDQITQLRALAMAALAQGKSEEKPTAGPVNGHG